MPDTVSFDFLHPARLTVEVGPEGLVALRLLEWAQAVGSAGLVHVARSDTRADRLLRALQGLAPTLEVLMLPPRDCVPYDRAGPSPEIMGRRIATLRRLTEQPRFQRLLITIIDAVMQRLRSGRVRSRPRGFRDRLVGFVLFTVWRAPPLVVVIVSALGGIALAQAMTG